MRFHHFALSSIFVTGLMAASAVPASAQSNWIGVWGSPAIPLPPGVTPSVSRGPVIIPALTPLGAVPTATARAAGPRAAGLLENPGNVPVVLASTPQANVTLRQLVRVSAAGRRIRLRLSSEESFDPVVIGAVHVGEAGPDGAVLPGTDRAVTFDGHAGVVMPSSGPLLSDPIDLPVKALDKLLVSVYQPGAVNREGHGAWQYVSGIAGDQTAQPQLPNQSLMRAHSMITQIEADSASAANVVVTLGDSITEGALSTANAFRGWPDRLAERLTASPEGRKWAVVNAGIGGNRLLHYGTGPTVLARLDRDVLSVPGVKAIILLEGINDIGDIAHGYFPGSSVEPATAEALIAADRQVIERAHEHGIRVIGATLTPFEGASSFTAKGEEVREALNHWIMTSGEFDGVIDFAPVVADPAHPTFYRAGFNIRDHLHPDDAGYAALGDSIDLRVITGGK